VEKKYEVQSVSLLNRTRWSGTRIREKMINGGDWRSDVPKQVAEIVEEIDGEGRLRDLAKSDGE
jgi:nicotinamide-nucleotide adenylyltransferase